MNCSPPPPYHPQGTTHSAVWASPPLETTHPNNLFIDLVSSLLGRTHLTDNSLKLLRQRTMASSRMLGRVVLVKADVSEDLSASFVMVTRIVELGTTLAVTNNRRTLRRNTKYQIVQPGGLGKFIKIFHTHRFSNPRLFGL
jgi:hypothetical protein